MIKYKSSYYNITKKARLKAKKLEKEKKCIDFISRYEICPKCGESIDIDGDFGGEIIANCSNCEFELYLD